MKIEDCKVGMKVRETAHNKDDKSHHAIITAVGETYVLIRVGYVNTEGLATPKYLEPVPEFPECWFNVYPTGTSGGFASRNRADDCQVRAKRIGVLHLLPDGTTIMEPA